MAGRLLPGADLVEAGLTDLARGVESIEALLVLIGAPRLRSCGIAVPETGDGEPEHRLFERLVEEDPETAHSRYNALIRRLVSYESALECGL